MKHRTFAMAAIVAIPLILLLTTILLARQFDQTRTLTLQAGESYDRRARIQTVLSLHQDIETGQRGYILTGNSAFLEPYEAARVKLGAAFKSLEGPVADHEDLVGELRSLRQLSAQKVGFADQTIRLRQEGRRGEATRLIASGRGKATMDAIRARIAALDAIERKQLDENIAKARTSRRTTQTFTLALQVLLLSLLIGAAWITHRAMAARRRDLERLRDLSARQEAIFDAASDGMLTFDPEGYIESLNPAAAALYGYRPEELIGRHVDVLFHEPPARENLEMFLTRLAARPRGKPSRPEEFVAKRVDGGTFTADVSISAVPLADGLHFVAVVRDVTERRRVEQMKTEFVSTVSHELRTPLTSIAGSLGLLSGGVAGALPERAARLIGIAHSNSERLVRLINDILDIEKIESGKMTFDVKPVLLRPLVEQALQANRAFAESYGTRLELEAGGDEAVVLADADRLTQVVTNLVSNAAKFSPKDEAVKVGISPLADKWRLTVADKGAGIPEAFRSRIFSKFAQADSSDTRQLGGTGLGLSIVKEIVTALGGNVSFDTVPGSGTSFHVDLPAAQAKPDAPDLSGISAPAMSPGTTPQSGEKPCILHVEDDADVLRVVASAFEKTADLKAVSDIDAARQALRERAYDLVILDLELPGGSGLDLLPEMRSEDGSPIPVVIFTADDSGREATQQVQAVLVKSRASLDELVRTVDAFVNRGRTGEE